MKRVLTVSMLALLLIGCKSTVYVAPPTALVKTNQVPAMPPLPPGIEKIRSMMPVMTDAQRSMSLTARSATMSAAALVPAEPEFPRIAKMTSFQMTNITAKLVHITFDMAAESFGLAYSDDMINWITVGEANWTNATPNNPFMEPGVTEHSIWITDPTWMTFHTPGIGTNSWKLHVFDLITPADRPQRFYKIYPLGPVTGLP